MSPIYSNSFYPWTLYNDDRKPSDDELVLAWSSFQPRDFVFGIKRDVVAESTIVVVVPRLFFDREKKIFHDSIPVLTKYLPDSLIECLPCVFETQDNLDYTKIQLMNTGFGHQSTLDKYMDDQLFSLNCSER